MKKAFLILLAIILALALTACGAENGNDPAKKNENNGEKTTETDDGKTEEKDEEKEEKGEEIDLTGIPEEWVKLFTFDNVTILLKNTLTIKRGDEYRCVDGKWNVKYQGRDAFEAHNGRYIFDLYLTNYDIFVYNEEYSYYKAENVTPDESGYLREITVSVADGKIVNITDVATLNSSSIVSTLDFSAYGTTVLD